MRYRPGSVCLLLLVYCYMQSTQAEVLFTASLPEHEGSVSIEGENRTCRSAVEAALRCDPLAKCTGIWYLDDGQNKYCQSAVCSEVTGKPNHVLGQSGLFFLHTGIFRTGKKMILTFITQKYSVHTYIHGCMFIVEYRSVHDTEYAKEFIITEDRALGKHAELDSPFPQWTSIQLALRHAYLDYYVSFFSNYFH